MERTSDFSFYPYFIHTLQNGWKIIFISIHCLYDCKNEPHFINNILIIITIQYNVTIIYDAYINQHLILLPSVNIIIFIFISNKKFFIFLLHSHHKHTVGVSAHILLANTTLPCWITCMKESCVKIQKFGFRVQTFPIVT